MAWSHIQLWLVQFGAAHAYLVYAVIVLIALAEGPILSIVLGLLLRLNYFSFFPVYVSIMLGDLIGDVILYRLGYVYGNAAIKKIEKYFHVTEKNIAKVKELFHTHTHKILFVSKITNGFGFAVATLTTAGIVRIPFWRYMTVNVIGQLFWSLMLIGIGYFFGSAFFQTHSIFGKCFLILIIVGIIFLVVRSVKRIRRKIEA